MVVVRSPVRSVVRSPVRGVFGGSASLIDDATSYLAGIAPYHWFDFVNDRCLYASNDVGGVSGATGYSFSRASTGTYVNLDGTVSTFASGQLRRGDRGVLIEGARTNAARWSDDLTNAAWNKLSGGTATSASTFDFTATSGSGFETSTGLTASAGTTVTASAWFSGSGTIRIGVIDASGAFAGTHQSITLTGTPTRVSVTRTLADANALLRVSNISGVAVTGATIQRLQLEAGAFPSSYIPTTTASVLRPADVLTCTAGVSTPFSMWAEMLADTVGFQRDIMAMDDTTNGEGLYIGGGNIGQMWVREASVTTANPNGGGSAIAANTAYKTAARFAVNNCNISNQGAIGTADTSNSPPNPTLLRFGPGVFAGTPLFGYLRRAAIFNSALSDANLQLVAPA